MLEKRIKELELQASSDIERLHKRINELRLRTIQENILIMSKDGKDNEKVQLAVVKLELEEE